MWPSEIHFHVRQFPSSSLPSSNEDERLSDWLKQLWREKEERLKNFYTTKSFPGITYVDTLIDKIKLMTCMIFHLSLPILSCYFYMSLPLTWCIILMLGPSLLCIIVTHCFGGWDELYLKLNKPQSALNKHYD